jgi:cell division protein FtsN
MIILTNKLLINITMIITIIAVFKFLDLQKKMKDPDSNKNQYLDPGSFCPRNQDANLWTQLHFVKVCKAGKWPFRLLPRTA